jgi:hypothetical protein
LSGSEDGDVVTETDTNRGILHAKVSETESGDTARVANTLLALPAVQCQPIWLPK